MNLRWRITLGAVAVVMVFFAVTAVVFPREPVYEGRRLSAWLRDLDSSRGTGINVELPARQAVKHLGTNALPFLLRMLKSQDPEWKSQSVTWLQDTCDLDLSGSLAEAQRQRALRGFQALGRVAEPAIPELRALTFGNDSLVALHALEALRGIGGPRVLPVLFETLNHTNPPLRAEAIAALGSARSRARDAVPQLLKELESPDNLTRIQAAQALGEIATHPELTIPALTRCLADPETGVKTAAAMALGSFGSSAISALPALRTLAESPMNEVQRFARVAVVRVQCEMRDGAIIRGPQDQRQLALVFTAHEYAEGAETILNELARHDAQASFFLTGAFLTNTQFSSLLDRLQYERHYLGPHSDQHLLYCDWDPARTLLVTEEEFHADLAANVAKIPGGWGEGRRFSRYFLPPYEHYNRDIADWTRAHGWVLINFTSGTRSNADYTGEADKNFVSSQKIFDSIIARERDDPSGLNGYILLLHLGAGPGRADKFHTRFGELLDYLALQGYEFVRVDELLRPPRDANFPGGFRPPGRSKG